MKNVFVRFECGAEDRMGTDMGPYEYVQMIYGSLTTSPDSENVLANFGCDGFWVTQDGQRWSDVVIFSNPA